MVAKKVNFVNCSQKKSLISSKDCGKMQIPSKDCKKKANFVKFIKKIKISQRIAKRNVNSVKSYKDFVKESHKKCYFLAKNHVQNANFAKQ